jgi:hypothetical protein
MSEQERRLDQDDHFRFLALAELIFSAPSEEVLLEQLDLLSRGGSLNKMRERLDVLLRGHG